MAATSFIVPYELHNNVCQYINNVTVKAACV